MREYKYRAWDNKNKKWLMGYSLQNLGGFSLTGEAILFGEWSKCFDQFIFEKEGLKKEDLIITDYTNIKDKFDKEIYEGDLLKDENGFIFKVEYCIQNSSYRIIYEESLNDQEKINIYRINHYFFPTNLGNGYYSRKDLEIIGNIFEYNYLHLDLNNKIVK